MHMLLVAEYHHPSLCPESFFMTTPFYLSPFIKMESKGFPILKAFGRNDLLMDAAHKIMCFGQISSRAWNSSGVRTEILTPA
jgi:hypothetical protein